MTYSEAEPRNRKDEAPLHEPLEASPVLCAGGERPSAHGLREQRHVRLREAAIRKVETCEGGALCDCKKHVTIASRDSAPREAQVKEMGGG